MTAAPSPSTTCPWSYDKRQIAHNVRFSIPPGQVTALIGPNGTRKSTLLGAVAGLLPSSGCVELDGTDLLNLKIDHRARHLAMVPQTTTLSISFPAREIIAIRRHPHRGCFVRGPRNTATTLRNGSHAAHARQPMHPAHRWNVFSRVFDYLHARRPPSFGN